MLLLTERDVRAVLPMPDLIAAMEQALAAYSSGHVVQPVRSVLELGPERNFFGVMPAAIDEPAALGAKLVTVYHGNHRRGLPSHLACIALQDPASGEMIALMDGRYITEARTAAVSAVSVKYMALPDARVLAIIGSGVQARSHLEAIRHVRTLSEVRVWSPSAMHREKFALEMTTPLLPVFPEESAADAVHRAEIVVLATAASTPVIESADINPGTHIAAVGACRADQREMPSDLVARARVVVDSRAGARKEAGDLIIPIAEGAIRESHIAGELGEVVLEQVAGRLGHTDVTVFKSLGMAVEDIVAARLVLRRAREARIGQRFSFS